MYGTGLGWEVDRGVGPDQPWMQQLSGLYVSSRRVGPSIHSLRLTTFGSIGSHLHRDPGSTHVSKTLDGTRLPIRLVVIRSRILLELTTLRNRTHTLEL